MQRTVKRVNGDSTGGATGPEPKGAVADLERVLEIESAPEIAEFRFEQRDTMMWPLVRWRVLTDAIVRTYLPASGSRRFSERPLKAMVAYVWQNLRHNALFLPRSQVLYVDKGKAFRKEAGGYANRITDPLALVTSGYSSIIESTGVAGLRLPRLMQGVGYYDLIKSAGERLVGLRQVGEADLRAIKGFLDYLKHSAVLDLSREGARALERELITISKSLAFRYRLYGLLIERIAPRIMVVECGHYGEQADLIRTAHEHGIPVAEQQHGYVGPSHPAYNFSDFVREDRECRRYYPDFFLGYGTFWGEQIRIPADFEVIGNPQLSEPPPECLGRRVGGSEPPTLLIVSNGADISALIRKAIQIADTDSAGWQLVLRPSPRDKGRITSDLSAALQSSNIELSDRENVYEDICRADCVVGEFSTVLFEAKGIGKPVFMLDSDYSKFMYGQQKHKVFEMVAPRECLAEDLLSRSQRDWSERLFARDWKRRYVRFLESHGVEAAEQ